MNKWDNIAKTKNVPVSIPSRLHCHKNVVNAKQSKLRCTVRPTSPEDEKCGHEGSDNRGRERGAALFLEDVGSRVSARRSGLGQVHRRIIARVNFVDDRAVEHWLGHQRAERRAQLTVEDLEHNLERHGVLGIHGVEGEHDLQLLSGLQQTTLRSAGAWTLPDRHSLVKDGINGHLLLVDAVASGFLAESGDEGLLEALHESGNIL